MWPNDRIIASRNEIRQTSPISEARTIIAAVMEDSTHAA